MTKLTDLGFSKGVICETIVSTYNSDGTPNAAPMGITMDSEDTLSIYVFNSSTTSRNIKVGKCAVINLTNDIEFFYKTAFKETDKDSNLPLEWFEKAGKVEAPKLHFADATIEVSLLSIYPINVEKTKAVLAVQQINAVKLAPQVYCRAWALTLEAIIHATRVQAFIGDKRQKDVNELLVIIKHCDETVNRVAPNSVYSRVMADLLGRIDLWRNKL
jgi:hypothetical protein